MPKAKETNEKLTEARRKKKHSIHFEYDDFLVFLSQLVNTPDKRARRFLTQKDDPSCRRLSYFLYGTAIIYSTINESGTIVLLFSIATFTSLRTDSPQSTDWIIYARSKPAFKQLVQLYPSIASASAFLSLLLSTESQI
ncbi:unnamed protein product [Allacma fusca]|uniref:Uncharacterized protein n=1 Tax=Allacma fusca TaxID=39272 RepID=A0A8J2PZ42_9HEXA|nr:unnamed protein product [Allacma fusca]